MDRQELYSLLYSFKSPCFADCFPTKSLCKQPQLLVCPLLKLVPIAVISFPQTHEQYHVALPYLSDPCLFKTVNLPNAFPVISTTIINNLPDCSRFFIFCGKERRVSSFSARVITPNLSHTYIIPFLVFQS